MTMTIHDQLRWADCPWELDGFQRGSTRVDVAYDWPDVRIRVCDRTSGDLDPTSETRARLSADGTVRLGAHVAPPALLLTSAGARLIPSVPGIDEIATMGPDDLLVLCSVCVLEQLPAGFSRFADGSKPPVGRDLLEALQNLTARGDGCAVVAKRRAPRQETK